MSMRFTTRDKQMIEFIIKHKAVNSSQLKRLFGLNDSTLSKRMKFICENSSIKKYKYNPQLNFYDSKYKEMIPNGNYYYYKRKPTNIMHTLVVNEVYLYLKERFDIIDYVLEYPIEYEDYLVRADVWFRFRLEGKEYEYLVEVEIAKSFNSGKYLKLQEGGIELPKIIVLSDRRVYNRSKYEIIKGRINLEDLENKIKEDILKSEYGYKEI